MTYATQSDMISRFGQDEIQNLTDRNNAGMIDVSVLGMALADADATINGYLAGRYILPLSVVPAALVKRAADLARYYLFGLQATDLVKSNHDDALVWLKQVNTGIIELGIEQQTLAAESSGISVQSNTRIFSASTLSDY